MGIKDVLEAYILKNLRSGHCVRIRGEYSERKDIHLWYDPKKEVFLLTENEFFNDLQCTCPALNISKNDVLALLIQSKVFCTKPCANQIRGTFDVVVRKGTHSKLSVRKINVEALSKRFLQDAREWLERMANDKNPYRS